MGKRGQGKVEKGLTSSFNQVKQSEFNDD